MSIKLPTLALLGLALVPVACQKAPEQDSYEDQGKTTTVASVGGGGSTTRTKISIPLSVERGTFQLLGTAATAYSVDLRGCLSGYDATVTEANLDGIEVYKDDRDCLAKLTTLTTGGVTYNNTNAGATDFTTWLANDTAVFASAGGKLISVKVVAQLQSPIANTEVVTYAFSELLDGASDYTFSEASVSDAHLITVESQEAPHFKVAGATFTGMDDVSGAPEFTFKLECVDDPTSATPTSVAMTDGTATNSVCGTVDLQDVEYKLVIDSYAGVLDINDADSIFGTAGATVTMPGDQYSATATNEGFNTSTLDGPGPLGTAGNEKMILILKAGISYTYYSIVVTTISQ